MMNEGRVTYFRVCLELVLDNLNSHFPLFSFWHPSDTITYLLWSEYPWRKNSRSRVQAYHCGDSFGRTLCLSFLKDTRHTSGPNRISTRFRGPNGHLDITYFLFFK